MEPTRSSLYVPGNRESWIETADDHGADVVILDLEDSVPPTEKDAAREIVADVVPELRDRGQRVQVRVNGHPNDGGGFVEHDLEAVVGADVEAVVVPNVREPDDVRRLDTVMTHIERREGESTPEASNCGSSSRRPRRCARCTNSARRPTAWSRSGAAR